ncbi:MAG: hypothetical protein ACRC0J_18165 [Shewanella oncorhynchi]
MLVKNNSSRLHRVGGVSIAPGDTADVPDIWSSSLPDDLEPVKSAADSKKSASKKSTDDGNKDDA